MNYRLKQTSSGTLMAMRGAPAADELSALKAPAGLRQAPLVSGSLVLETDPARRVGGEKIRVLYSFPHKIGAARICTTAWHQVDGLVRAGVDVRVCAGVVQRPVNAPVVRTLSWGRLRASYKLLGTLRACAIHDAIVARKLERWAGRIDIVHVWPQAALRTIAAAKRLGIPSVLERPNAHTRFAYEVVQRECERLGVFLPPGHEHAFNERVLRVEEEEFRQADYLLCPSDFVERTFLDRGFSASQMVRHHYGYDDKVFFPESRVDQPRPGLKALFVGVCAVRKGLHYALEAWGRASIRNGGEFLIAGEFLPAYREKLAPLLALPGVRALGHRNDVPALMRQSDLLVLPSIEEGFPLACVEGMGSGCIPLVSEACSAACKHMESGLVHRIGEVEALAEHFSLMDRDAGLQSRLREEVLRTAPEFTWSAAGRTLRRVYADVIDAAKPNATVAEPSTAGAA